MLRNHFADRIIPVELDTADPLLVADELKKRDQQVFQKCSFEKGDR